MSFDAAYVQPGKDIDYTPTSAVPAGAIVIQGGLVGVAKTDIPANTLGALSIEGLFDVKKATTVAITAGAKVYWNTTSGHATTVASGNTLLGLAAENVSSAGALVKGLRNK